MMQRYSELSDLESINLEDSFVLAIAMTGRIVALDMDFVLTPQHPLYCEPPSSDSACFRRGRLEFHGIREFHFIDSGVQPAIDANGEIDLGHVDDMQWDQGRYRLEGDWGEMEIVTSEMPVVGFL